MKKFWMVYLEGGGSPNRKHETLISAQDEAARLASKHSTTAYVLVSTASCTPRADVTWTLLEEK